MRWQGRQGSTNVDDRRGKTLRRTGRGIGLGGIIIIVLALLMGENPLALLGLLAGQGGGAMVEETTTVDPAEQPLVDFVSVVLKDTEDVWQEVFREQLGQGYLEPTLVLFSGQVQSVCGFASAASGPFYCPADSKVYVDLSFYKELNDFFEAPGDFPMAYVIAHEVGHHVQNLLGITDQVAAQRGRISQEEYNELSVRLELQADFLAGVWVHHADRMKQILEEGDIEEALRAAAAIGDDRIQSRTQGYVVPESFTHGTSEQRKRWLLRGMESGELDQGDTFRAAEL
jgi:predicted metalloprotease